jgi:hypothetical protein
MDKQIPEKHYRFSTRYEQEEATLLLRKWELEQASKPDRKLNLEEKIRFLTNQRDECQTIYNTAKDDLQNYWCKITAIHSGKVLDVSGASMGDANVLQWTWRNVDHQKWKFVPVGDGYDKIVAKHSNKVLDVSERKKTTIGMFGWLIGIIKMTNNQKWKPERLNNNNYIIFAKHSNKVLNVSGNSRDDGGNVQQYEKQTGDNKGQEWHIERLNEYPNNTIDDANKALQDKKSQLAEATRQLNVSQ